MSEIGTFTDLRDGSIYKTVQIGRQIWMAENFAFKAGNGCWAYDDDQSNSVKYGFLYDWETAKKVCPLGWHLPGNEEWNILTESLGGEKAAGSRMKSTSGWENNGNGTNISGFTGLHGGFRDCFGTCYDLGFNSYWWSSTGVYNHDFWIRLLYYNSCGVFTLYNFYKDGLSVRYLMDTP
jgi:uncharacterized protein (TIGR02145 family)